MYCNKRATRGVKRKFGEAVDEEEDEMRVKQIHSSPPLNGLKSNEAILRNCLTNTSSSISSLCSNYSRSHQLNSQSPCVDTRRIIFNLSMGKLSKYRQSPDPRLVRSVLICNTLKRLEKELEKEGIKINFGPSGVSFFPPVTNTQNMTLDPPPNATQALPNLVNAVNSVNGSYVNDSNYCSAVNDVKSDEDETDTERYLLDLDSTTGRVTPFLRSSTECLYEKEASSELSSTDSSSLSPSLSASSSSPLSQSLSPSSSALWNIDENADRLSSLNWSSVLNFSETSTVTGASTVEKEALEPLPQVATPTSDRYDANVESSSEKSLVTALSGNGATSLHTLMPPSTHSETVSSVSHLINHHHLHHHHHHHHLTNSSCSSSSSPTYSSSSANDEIFGDIDLTLYDFDLISPLSPPNVKLAPVSAEELIQSV